MPGWYDISSTNFGNRSDDVEGLKEAQNIGFYIFSLHFFISYPSFPILHFLSFISFPSFPILHFLSSISFISFLVFPVFHLFRRFPRFLRFPRFPRNPRFLQFPRFSQFPISLFQIRLFYIEVAFLVFFVFIKKLTTHAFVQLEHLLKRK
jgi:hypothetical protein